MAVNDRMFEPPTQDLAKIHARIARLPPSLRASIQRAGDALAKGDMRTAQAELATALTLATNQPDVLRLYGLLLSRLRNLPAAVANFEAALRAAPGDAMGYWQYAQVCEDAGDEATAGRLREQAVQRVPDSPLAWSDLGDHLARHGRPEQALGPLERAAQLAPDYAPAQLTLGNALVSCGRVEEGAAAVRRAIGIEPAFGAAWLNLVDIKTLSVGDDEAERMDALLRGKDIDEGERTAIKFALARVREDHGRYGEAFDLLVDANARRKGEVSPWNVQKFLAGTRRAEEVFDAPLIATEDRHLGNETLFIAGMPRSGTTLVEQILASHPEVRGAGELGELAQVLTEESSRRKRLYPEWVPDARAEDWLRLGRRYLELTARFRMGHSRSTDKMPDNWQAIGAIRAMLPGARIIVCRRDPVENCWSCFKQYFSTGWEFTNDLDHLARFWRAFDRAATSWARRAPERIREQRYEALTESPETEIRALLEFCGLPFDPACLRAHEVRRSVQTLSAAQVREPLHRHRVLAEHYGELLDPLRRALGLPSWAELPRTGTS